MFCCLFVEGFKTFSFLAGNIWTLFRWLIFSPLLQHIARPLVKVKLSDWAEKQLCCLFMFCAFVIKRKIQINHFLAHKIQPPPNALSIDVFNLIPSHHKSPSVLAKYWNSCFNTQNFSEGISLLRSSFLINRTTLRSSSLLTFFGWAWKS